VQLDKYVCKIFGCVSVNDLHVIFTAIDTYMHNIGLFLRGEGLRGGVYVRFDFFGFWCLTMFPMAFPQIPNDILGAGLIFLFAFWEMGKPKNW
jgi:hypothetical protein